MNVDEVPEQAASYVQACAPETTVFEGAASSDPVAVEVWTGSLAKAVRFLARLENAAFRFATRYCDVDGLLDVDHRGKTVIRSSINCEYVIDTYEQGAPSLDNRIKAAAKVAATVYPSTTLPLDEAVRRFKRGQFGYGKYVYATDLMTDLTESFRDRIAAHFPESTVLYVI